VYQDIYQAYKLVYQDIYQAYIRIDHLPFCFLKTFLSNRRKEPKFYPKKRKNFSNFFQKSKMFRFVEISCIFLTFFFLFEIPFDISACCCCGGSSNQIPPPPVAGAGGGQFPVPGQRFSGPGQQFPGPGQQFGAMRGFNSNPVFIYVLPAGTNNSNAPRQRGSLETGSNATGRNEVGPYAVGRNGVGRNSMGRNAVGRNSVGPNELGRDSNGRSVTSGQGNGPRKASNGMDWAFWLRLDDKKTMKELEKATKFAPDGK
jgi:hypothetical protein